MLIAVVLEADWFTRLILTFTITTNNPSLFKRYVLLISRENSVAGVRSPHAVGGITPVVDESA